MSEAQLGNLLDPANLDADHRRYLQKALGAAQWLIEGWSKYKLDGSKTFAFPVENVDPAVALGVATQLTELNVNANSAFFVEGYFANLHSLGQKIAEDVFDLPTPGVVNEFGVLTSPSATFSLLQATTAATQWHYREKTGGNFLKDGAAEASKKGFIPVIIAPTSAKFLVDDVVQRMGWGKSAAQYYDVDDSFQPDPKSLDALLAKLKANNQEPVLHLIFGGDATRGIFHSNVQELAEVHKSHYVKPIMVADASSQWAVAYATKKNRLFDFANDPVDMIIADPQKIGGVYFSSWLFMRNCQIFQAYDDNPKTINPVHDLPRKAIMSSKGITPDFAFTLWWYIYGQEGLDEKGFHDFELAQGIRERIKQSEFLQLYPCDGRIASYGVKEKIGVTNWQLAQALNNGTTSVGAITVGYDTTLRAKTVADLEESKNGGQHDGLFGTVTGMHTEENLNQVFDQIETAIQELSKPTE